MQNSLWGIDFSLPSGIPSVLLVGLLLRLLDRRLLATTYHGFKISMALLVWLLAMNELGASKDLNQDKKIENFVTPFSTS